jgi:hypothetical protein
MHMRMQFATRQKGSPDVAVAGASFAAAAATAAHAQQLKLGSCQLYGTSYDG